jgi:hypothetical protein
METDEFDKVVNGPDGQFGEVESDPTTAVAPLPLATLGSEVTQAFVISKDTFNIVSGTRSEARGVADRTTATQATIVDQRSRIRETRPKVIVANWLNKIARHIMMVQQRITLPFWIEVNNTQEEELLGNVQETQKLYQQITGLDIEGDDFNVQINVASMSPIDTEDNKNRFLEFMAIINNYPQIALSPVLIRETATQVGYKTNEKVLRDLQNMALLAQAGQQAQMQGALAQRTTAGATPPAQEQITNQLTNQVGLPTQ